MGRGPYFLRELTEGDFLVSLLTNIQSTLQHFKWIGPEDMGHGCGQFCLVQSCLFAVSAPFEGSFVAGGSLGEPASLCGFTTPCGLRPMLNFDCGSWLVKWFGFQ